MHRTERVLDGLSRIQPNSSPVPAVVPPAGYLVFMVRPDLDNIPPVPWPEGFSARPMQLLEAGLWTDIWRDAEPFLTLDDELFFREFGEDLPAVPRRCFLIVNAQGLGVGTFSAWYSRSFKGQDYGRIHWVAVRRDYQGRGLAKAAVSFALNQMTQWHSRCWLATTTGRVGAIKIYLDFGFVPDLDEPKALTAWRHLATALRHPTLARLGLY